MTPDQLHILQHSLGLDEYGRGTMFRNHFVTGEGSTDHSVCMQLFTMGFMTRSEKHKLCGGSDLFNVTEAGKQAVIANSPAPPKLTRSQQNYQNWLDYDGGLSFIEYLQWKAHRKKIGAEA